MIVSMERLVSEGDAVEVAGNHMSTHRYFHLTHTGLKKVWAWRRQMRELTTKRRQVRETAQE